MSALKTQKSLNISLIIINLSIVLLFALAVALPPLVTWFVEVRNKDQGLPTVVMLTCYPCFPFAVFALFSLRKFFKNCIDGNIFSDKNINHLRVVSIWCLCGAVISFIAGFYYLPFFVVSISAGGCALVTMVVKDVFAAELASRREKLLDDIGEEV